MKKINLILLMSLIFGAAILNSCKDDPEEVIPDAPSVSAPSSTTNVEAGQSVDISFTVNVPGGYALSNASAQGGNVTVSDEPDAGATSGTVVISFTAGQTEGAASVTLTVTDQNQKSDNATAVLSVDVEETEVLVSQNISENVTWETGKVYILGARITVLDGVTLTIEPGVIVKGQAGTGPNATALLVARGGILMAEGTAEAPIIFTSVADEIMPGEIASPNLDPDIDGLWGGVIVLGKAPISAPGDATSFQIEGIPPSDQNGLYGGDVPNDNSGVIRYISIRHGGSNIGEGNEINGLTLGGVGSGTVIENVEVVANQDDGIEWFGGTVNVTNAIIWNSGDDALDTDQAWAGTINNFVLICGPNTDHALEIDGPEGSYLEAHTVKNGSVKGHPDSELGDFRDGARGTFENIYFFNFPDPATDGRGDFSLSGDKTLTSFSDGNLVFNNLQVTLASGVSLSSVFKHGTDAHATSVDLGANTIGADASKFADWTWVSVAGELAGF
jgi:hypothetical protein